MIRSYSMKEHGQVRLSKNFRVSEFRCKDGNDLVIIDEDLVSILQKARDTIGKAIFINSAYRTPIYNRRVGGSPSSYHMIGMAADIHVIGMTSKELYDIIDSIRPNDCGLIMYSNFVHVDTRNIKYREEK